MPQTLAASQWMRKEFEVAVIGQSRRRQVFDRDARPPQFSLETNQEAGMWGGKDEDERRRLPKVWRSGRRPMTSAVR